MSVRVTRGTLAGFAFVLGIAWPAVTDAKADLNESYGKLPLHFEANQGQTHKDVRFLSRGPGYGLYLTGNEAVLVLSTPDPEKNLNTRSTSGQPATPAQTKPVALRMSLIGAAPAPLVSGLEELPGKANYFVGKDSSQWRTNVPTYAKVHYREVYPGIDLVYYGNQRQLEYDFIVSPDADPGKIALTFKGAKRLEIDAQGDLVLHLPGGAIRQHKPVIYQDIDGVRQEIAGSYVRKGANRVGFKVAAYDRSRPLVIDPVVLAYSTYLGGNDRDFTSGIAVDTNSNVYVAGVIRSTDFPTTAGAFQSTYGGGFSDTFVTKLNPAGSALVYSTYLGGNSDDQGFGIVVDASGNAYVTGRTISNNFPTTTGAFQTSGIGVFVTKLNPAGSVAYSTLLGDGSGNAIAVDAAGNAYVTGDTQLPNLPTTAGALQASHAGGTYDAFVTKLNPAGSALVYSTYLGGNGWDRGFGIAVDAAGNAYVTGETASLNFPTTVGAFQPVLSNNSTDVFVSKLNSSGSGLIYSTLLGGSGTDSGTGIALDAAANAYVTGTTGSRDFPNTSGAFQTANATANGEGNIGWDTFVTKLNPTGSALVYSTYLGSSRDDLGKGIAVDANGNAHVTGTTFGRDFPTTSGPYRPTAPGGAFVTKLNPGGSALVYSTYLGGGVGATGRGIAVDTAGNAYVTGYTDSNDFPTTPGAFQPIFVGSFTAAFIAKIIDNSSPPQPFRLEGNAASFAGNWSFYGVEIGTFSGGSIAAANQAGATATFRFTGTSVNWIGVKCNACGIATISIDGGTPVSVNTFGPRASGNLVSENVFSVSGLAPGVTHTLTITVTGTSAPGSGGTYIAVDAFDVMPVRQEQSAAAYTGSWPSYGSDAGTFSGGNVVASNQTDATATFSFLGTAVSWLGARCNVCGIATVSIDGGAPVTVNTFGLGAPGSLVWDSVYYASGLAPGVMHTLRISVTGAADPASGGSYVAVDGFDVTR